MRERLAAFVTGRVFLPLAILLVGIRFAAPTVTAYLGVRGVDTTALDGAFEFYAGILPAILFSMAALILLSWPRGFRWDWATLLAAALTAVAAVLWPGEVDPGLRIVSSPWTSLVFGVIIAGTIVAFEVALELRIVGAGASAFARDGFRAFGGGFALAYLLRSLRLVDYLLVLGQPLPSGAQWLLNYGPMLVLSLLAICFWALIAARTARGAPTWIRALAPPAAAAVAGFVVSEGLGGFILSSALTWGGSYAVFVPTSASLSLVGFAVGAFFATAWILYAALPRPVWRLVSGGIVVAALAGILPFGGGFASLAGIVLGLVCAARGILEDSGPRRPLRPPSLGECRDTNVGNHRE